MAALRAQNLAAPVGNVNSALEQRSIRLEGRLERPEDFAALVVAQRGTASSSRSARWPTSRPGAAEPTSAALYNGRAGDRPRHREVARVQHDGRGRRRESARRRRCSRRCRQGRGSRSCATPACACATRCATSKETLVEGALLTVLVVFLFLNSWRSTVITGLALPVSVLAAFVPLLMLGFTLNTMSLLGLSLAIGILIDDAIVVRENIVRHVEMGADHMAAAHEGTDEIGLAVAATTFSIVAVFVPVGFMPGVAGQWFKPFALTIAAAVLVSLFVSFSLDPMLSAYWADPQLEAHERRNPIARTLDRFNRWFDRQAERYKHGHRAGRSITAGSMIALAAASFVVAIALQVAIGGFGFVPVSDNSEIEHRDRDAAGLEPRVHDAQGRRDRAADRARAHGSRVHVHDGRQRVAAPAASDNATHLRPPRCRRTSARSARTTLGQHAAQGDARRSAARRRTRSRPDSAARRSSCSSSSRGPTTLCSTARRADRRDRVQARPGAVDVGLSTKGQKPELNVQRQPRTRRHARRERRPARARRCGSRSPASTRARGSIPAAISRYVHVRLVPSARENAADLGQLPVLVTPAKPARRRADAAVRPARPGRATSRRARDRRRSTTISASAS